MERLTVPRVRPAGLVEKTPRTGREHPVGSLHPVLGTRLAGVQLSQSEQADPRNGVIGESRSRLPAPCPGRVLAGGRLPLAGHEGHLDGGPRLKRDQAEAARLLRGPVLKDIRAGRDRTERLRARRPHRPVAPRTRQQRAGRQPATGTQLLHGPAQLSVVAGGMLDQLRRPARGSGLHGQPLPRNAHCLGGGERTDCDSCPGGSRRREGATHLLRVLLRAGSGAYFLRRVIQKQYALAVNTANLRRV